MTDNIPALNQGINQKSSRYIFAESLFKQAEAEFGKILNSYMYGGTYDEGIYVNAQSLYWMAFQTISTGKNLSKEDKELQAAIQAKHNRYFPNSPINN